MECWPYLPLACALYYWRSPLYLVLIAVNVYCIIHIGDTGWAILWPQDDDRLSGLKWSGSWWSKGWQSSATVSWAVQQSTPTGLRLVNGFIITVMYCGSYCYIVQCELLLCSNCTVCTPAAPDWPETVISTQHLLSQLVVQHVRIMFTQNFVWRCVRALCADLFLDML